MNRLQLCAVLISMTLISFTTPAVAQVSFQPPTFTGMGTVFVADFNNDGKLDLLISDGTINLGNGDGTFTKGTSLSVNPAFPVGVTDFDGNGKPDILEYDSTRGQLLVLLGNGNGTFQNPVATQIGTGVALVTAVDLDGDGKADVIGLFNGALMVCIGNGDGTFKQGVLYPVGSTSYAALSFGDFNGDQKTDVVVSVSGQEIVLLGNGDGTFQSAKPSTGVSSPGNAAVGDFNGDHQLDLALDGCDTSNNCGPRILLGKGDGTFQSPSAALSVSAVPGIGLATGDLNGDGKLDLVLQSTAGELQIFVGNGDGTFLNSGNYLDSGNTNVVIADLNNDGKLDIAAGNLVLLGNGTGNVAGVPLSLVPASPAQVIGKFDKNGTQDVAVVSGKDVSILSNDGTGVLSVINTYTLQQPGYAVVTADLNGDGNLDLAVFGTDPSGNWNYSVLLGNGDGSFQIPVFYPETVQTNATSYSVSVADFNSDNKLDFAVASGNQNLALLLGSGDGTFAPPSYVYDAGASFIVAGDFNSDGKLDIAAGFGPPTVSARGTALLFGKVDGTFQAAALPTNLQNFVPQFVADLNHDGKQDLVSISAAALGNGDGTFAAPAAIAYEVDAIADINGDGIPDVVAAKYSGAFRDWSGIELGNGDGTFGPFIQLPILLPSNVLAADMNGDGKLDLVFPWSNGYPVSSGIAVMLNITPKAVPDFSLSPSSGSSTSQTSRPAKPPVSA